MSNGNRIVEVDRGEAIRRTLGMAQPGDTVVIAGKGHEDYQIVGTERRHFSDREVARAVLDSRDTGDRIRDTGRTTNDERRTTS
jgi:UDP-N-acetylmuramoyl-L-alanyl-D-glutamate--2,6-diaminopimelate ligase